MYSRPTGAISLLSLLLGGCTSLPSFSGPPGLSSLQKQRDPTASIPTVDDVVKHIQCEIWKLPKPTDGAAPTADQQPFVNLWKYQYVVYALLTIDVTDDGQLSPSFDFIHLLSAASTNWTVSVNPQYGSTGHRNVTLAFTLDLDPQGNPIFDPGKNSDGHVRTLDQYCADAEGSGIKGDLGIKDIVAEGLKHTKEADFLFPLATSGDQAGALGLSSAIAPSFGSTIDFTLTYGLNGGPQWTLSHFTGPTGGSNPFLSYTRTHKDTLQLSFAAAQERAVPSTVKAEAVRAYRTTGAAKAATVAKDSATLSLLQRIIPLTH